MLYDFMVIDHNNIFHVDLWFAYSDSSIRFSRVENSYSFRHFRNNRSYDCYKGQFMTNADYIEQD